MLFTAMIMVVCTVRLFEEGEVLYPFHLAIATIRLASRTLLRVLFLTLVLSVSLTMVYGLLFGMTDDTLSIERGVAKMFHMLWAPASLNPEYVKQSAAGAYVLYYFCLFVMRLIFGSLFIAIIVGSFNTARKEIHKALASDVLREAGYRYVIKHSSVENRIIGGKVVRQTFMMSDRVWVLYMMTWYAFGGFLPIVYRNLIRMKASNCGLGKGKDGLCVLYTKREMDEFLGMKTSRALLAVFRVERNNGSRSKRYSWSQRQRSKRAATKRPVTVELALALACQSHQTTAGATITAGHPKYPLRYFLYIHMHTKLKIQYFCFRLRLVMSRVSNLFPPPG